MVIGTRLFLSVSFEAYCDDTVRNKNVTGMNGLAVSALFNIPAAD